VAAVLLRTLRHSEMDWIHANIGNPFFQTFLGVLLGGLINAFFSRRASQELKQEAENLRRETEKVRHYSRATITWLKEAGL
jgi:hypothetical protein